MENPFLHNRAMNVIGRVLDEDKALQEKGELSYASLEARIAFRLEAEGLLTDKAFEVVGLEGRFGN